MPSWAKLLIIGDATERGNNDLAEVVRWSAPISKNSSRFPLRSCQPLLSGPLPILTATGRRVWLWSRGF